MVEIIPFPANRDQKRISQVANEIMAISDAQSVDEIADRALVSLDRRLRRLGFTKQVRLHQIRIFARAVDKELALRTNSAQPARPDGAA